MTYLSHRLQPLPASFQREWPDYDREYGIRRDLVELAEGTYLPLVILLLEFRFNQPGCSTRRDLVKLAEAYVGTEQQQTEKMLALLNLAIAMNNQVGSAQF